MFIVPRKGSGRRPKPGEWITMGADSIAHLGFLIPSELAAISQLETHPGSAGYPVDLDRGENDVDRR